MKKKHLLIALPLVAIVLAGAGCDVAAQPPAPAQTAYQSDSAKTEATQETVQKAVPIPQINQSIERQNISKRATTFDVQNKTSYIYLIDYGKVMAFYTITGKVSSLNSYLTPSEQLVDGSGEPCTNVRSGGGSSADSWEPCYAVSSPDIDGAYGDNADGVFFFTTDGAYVEWKGNYMMSDQPLQLSTPPELVRQITK